MSTKRRLRRTVRHIQARWPVYFGLYGALISFLLFIGLSIAAGWYSFVPFSMALILVVSYVLIALVYVAYRMNDAPGGSAADILFDLAQTRPEDKVVCLDLGLRETPVVIARHLTTGEVTVVDLYNPQSNTSASLRRARKLVGRPPVDPRLNWIDGTINLLPLPDRSVTAVYMNQILSEFWLHEERQQLLEEARRILVPEGRLLVAEPVRAQTNFLLAGLITYFLPSPEFWGNMLTEAGFTIRRQENARGLLYCVRADKPSPTAGKQLHLQLEFI